MAVGGSAGRDAALEALAERRDGPRRDIVVIGGSAGSIEALRGLVPLLPPEFPAAVFVVVHVLPTADSRLPHILGIRGPLPVKHAVAGDRVEPGRILVAPPDHHMVLRDGRVELSHGPRVNSARPAIDPLFLSAAEAYGPRVCGIILSGYLDDGSNGLRVVAERGGVAMVQDPEQALYPEMPRNAVGRVPSALVMTVEEIAAALARAGVAAGRNPAVAGNGGRGRNREEAEDPAVADDHEGILTGLTCPECHGPLWAVGPLGKSALECRVGHRFTFESLQQEQQVSVERAMWAAVRALREEASLARHLASQALSGGRRQAAERYRLRERQADRHADVLQGLVIEEPPQASEGHASA